MDLLTKAKILLKPSNRKSRQRLDRHETIVAERCETFRYRTSGCAKQAIVLYEYQPTRKAEHTDAFLKGFSGWLHADGYQGYHKLPENIRVVGCWAHARRKFDETLQTLPKEMQKDAPATIGECYCSRLFKLEQAFAELTPEER